jgi:hypothetical protein
VRVVGARDVEELARLSDRRDLGGAQPEEGMLARQGDHAQDFALDSLRGGG